MKGRRWLGFALACLMCWTGSTQVLAGTISSGSAKQEAAGNVSAGYAATPDEDEGYMADGDTGAASEGVFFEEVDVSSMVYQAGGFGTPVREDAGIAAYTISTEEQIKSEILQALLAKEESLDVSAYGMAIDEVKVLFSEVLNENGELFYVQSSLSYWSLEGKITKLEFNYNSVTDEQKQAFADKLAEVTSLVTDTMSETEKALILHDYLAQHCAYAYQEYLDGTLALANCPNVYDAYGALIRGRAVCQGYAMAYQALLKEVGIQSSVCTSDSMNHAWNVVLIDGSWYHVDVTWDDPTWNREGRACHEYFLLSDTEMTAREHEGWASNIECDSAKYDAKDYWWREVDSQIVQIASQDYVYVKDVSGKFQLVRRTGETENVIYNNNLYWDVWEGSGHWLKASAFLSRRGNDIYFNDRDNVYSLSLDDLADADPEMVYTYDKNDGYIYGAMVYEDGKIRLSIRQSPDDETDDFFDAGETIPVVGVQTGSVDGIVEGSVTWTYDPTTREVVVTGSGRREEPANILMYSSCFPKEATGIRFENCEISGSCGGLFKDLTALETINFSGFNTGNVTDMSFMFCGCVSLSSLDVSGFDTSNVTNMWDMFYFCRSLTRLDVSGFDTSNVTNMGFMFSDCSSLSSLDVSGFTTGNVTYMGAMFNGCSSLPSLDVSGFDTSNVTSMGAMFNDCSSLSSLDVSGFVTGNVTDMEAMFSYCSSLPGLDVRGFDTGNVTSMGFMFNGCSSLSNLDVSEFVTGNVTNMEAMFANCSSLPGLDVRGFDTGNVTNMGLMFNGCSSLSSLDVSEFVTGNVTNMEAMFANCSSLPSLDVSEFATGNVTNMSYMFSECSSLPSLDVSGFVTGNVIDMEGMFYDCCNLSSLDVSGFATGNVTNMGYMFSNCSSLPSLDVSGFDTRNVTRMWGVFYGCSSLPSLDVSGFVTVNVTNMKDMFGRCSSLTSLDVSGFVTGNVTNMECMFSDCSNLPSLDVSGFDTGNVTNMESMFDGCSNLSSLDVSGFATGNVTNMAYMFVGCSSLPSLDVSGFATGNVTNMDAMFFGCSSLSSLDVSGFATGNVTNMESMFGSCRSLSSLDVSGFATGNVTDMEGMFEGCSSLPSLDVSGFDTGNVTSMWYMFDGCSSLSSLDVSGFDTGNVTSMYGMFSCCSSLPSLDVSGFDTGNVTDMRHMFDGCSNLSSLDVSGFNTRNVTNMWCMFSGCSNLPSLDVRGFDTGNVRNMLGMFNGCSSLSSLNVSGLATGNVTSMYGMFNGCSSLTSLDLSSFSISNETEVSSMFTGCSSLTSLNAPKQIGQNAIALPDTFTDPAGNKTTELTPAYAGKMLTKGSKVSIPFADVEPDAWYYSAIVGVYNKGYMSGKGDGSFSPAGFLTRGEIATVLYNMSERPDIAYEEHFGDIPSGQWYSAPVTWVYKNKIAAGYGNGDFGVADRLTREQLAVMLYQYARHLDYNLAYDDSALEKFPDKGSVSSWAETAMKWAVSKKIINGTGDGYLKPDGNATRAECASVINGFTEKVN